MSNSFYARPPQKDGRYARKLINDSSKEISDFLRSYKQAQEKNDCNYYQLANDKRESLITLQETLNVELDFLPAENQGMAANVAIRLRETLLACPIFPPPILNNPAAKKGKKEKPATSDIVTNAKGQKKDADLGANAMPHSVIGNAEKKTPAKEAPKKAAPIEVVPVVTEPKEAGIDAESNASTLHTASSEIANDGDDEEMMSDNDSDDQHHRSVSEVWNKVGPKKTKWRSIPWTTGLATAGSKASVMPAVETTDAGIGPMEGVAGCQRDTFLEKHEAYLSKIRAKGVMLSQKLDKGEDFDENDAELYSTVMDEEGTYWRKSTVGAPSETMIIKEVCVAPSIQNKNVHAAEQRAMAGTFFSAKAMREVETNRNAARACAESGEINPQIPYPRADIQNLISGGCRPKTKEKRNEGEEVAPKTVANVFPSLPKPMNSRPPAQLYEQPPDTRPARETTERNRNPAPAELRQGWNEPYIPPTLPARTTQNPTLLRAAANTFNPPNANHAPQVSNGLPRRDEVNERIMITGLERECRAIVASLRPPKEKRFNGDLEKVDYEIHQRNFQKAMKQPGINDEIRVSELQFWYTGVAMSFIELYNQTDDTAEQYRLIVKKLNEKYGNKSNSVENLLEKILSGNEIKSGDQKAIDLFSCELEKFDINATKLGRRALLDSPDTIHRIIRSRIPYIKGRWIKERTKKAQRWDGVDIDSKELTFKQLISFISGEAEYAEQKRMMEGKTAKPKTIAINALSSEAAKPSRGRGGGRTGRGGGNNANENAPTTANVSAISNWNATSANRGTGPGRGRGGGGGRFRGGGGGRGGFQTPNLGNGTFGFKPTSMLSGNQSTVTSANANTNQQQVRFGQCMHCENTALHALDTCNKFLQADIQRRHDMMKRGGHCYKCLDRNHKAQDCSVDSLRCEKCNKNNHHTLLHRGASGGVNQ